MTNRPDFRKYRQCLAVALAATFVLAAPLAVQAQDADVTTLLKQKNCMACHATQKKLIGPAFVDIAKKYQGDQAAPATLAKHVRQGSVGVWGPIPMPTNPQVSEAEAQRLVGWILEQR